MSQALLRGALVAALFGLLCLAFFAAIGQPPLALLGALVQAAAGSRYALTETLVRATPILLCALATAVPARMGLISVGAEGQLVFGALLGTGCVLALPAQLPATVMLPAMLAAGALGGALWAAVPATLRALAGVNETLSTLLLNYVAALLVTWLVFGAWKDPASLGWPATRPFPDAARLPSFWDSRVHLGLWLALAAALLVHVLLGRTRIGLTWQVLGAANGSRLAAIAGIGPRRHLLLAMALGGALAGLAGIAEASAIQGRLQQNLSGGAGLSGFLVAWAAGHHALRMVPMALLVGGLLAAGDGIQMMAGVPSSLTLVIQGLLFVAVLALGQVGQAGRPLLQKRGAA